MSALTYESCHNALKSARNKSGTILQYTDFTEAFFFFFKVGKNTIRFHGTFVHEIRFTP